MEKSNEITVEFLTSNGRKCVLKQFKKKTEELEVFLSYKKETSDSTRDDADIKILHENTISVLRKEISICKKMLELPVMIVAEQNTYCRPGNGVRIKVDGDSESTYLVIDGICPYKHKLPKNHKIVGATSPMGKAIIGMKVGEKGSYTIKNILISFIVEKIDLPSKAKWIFKYDKPIADFIDEPMSEIANG